MPRKARRNASARWKTCSRLRAGRNLVLLPMEVWLGRPNKSGSTCTLGKLASRKVHRTVSGSLIFSGPLHSFLWYTGRLGPPRSARSCQQHTRDSCEKRGLLATTACWPDPVGALQVRSGGRAWNASRSFVAWPATQAAYTGLSAAFPLH
jgi:hypothetical protein